MNLTQKKYVHFHSVKCELISIITSCEPLLAVIKTPKINQITFTKSSVSSLEHSQVHLNLDYLVVNVSDLVL